MILTIIIPLYNKKNYIITTLESILNEITQEIEVIIIDDCSTDGSVDKVEKYMEKNLKDKNIKFLKNVKNIGVSATRNKGLDISSGEYIMFLDADDKLKKNFYREILPLLQNKNLEMICLTREYSSLKKIEVNYKEILPLEKIKISDFFYEVEDFKKVLDKKIFLGGSGEIITQKKLIEKERFNEKLSIMEDYDFYFKVLKKIEKVYFYIKPVIIIEDIVEQSLSSKRIKFNEINNFFILENSYLKENLKLLKRIFWILMYSNISRLDFFDRVRFLKKEKKRMVQLVQINKYMFGCIGMILGIDINKLRKKIKLK